MKAIGFVTATVLVILANGPAGAAVDLDEPRSGLEFRVGSSFSLGSFEDAHLSWKLLRSPTRGWRFGVSPVARDERSEYADDRHYQEQTYELEAFAMRLFLSPLRDRTRFYWGLGPLAGASYRETERVQPMPSGPDEVSRSVRRSWHVGARAIVAVEYFFADGLSLMGEYGLDVTRRMTYEPGYGERDVRSWHVGTRGARLGLSVLF